jgi:DNA-binding Lrp family transcriptional regulator
MQDHNLDEIDITILRILMSDCRASYRSMGVLIGMSTNAIRTRFKRLVSQGIVQRFITLINLAIFGYFRTCYLVLRNSETLSKLTEQDLYLSDLFILYIKFCSSVIYGVPIVIK